MKDYPDVSFCRMIHHGQLVVEDERLAPGYGKAKAKGSSIVDRKHLAPTPIDISRRTTNANT